MSDIWTRLRAIDPPIGDGGRSWYPFDLRSEVRDAVADLPDPVAEVVARLADEPEPLWRLTLLVLLAHQEDSRVDEYLIAALDDSGLRPGALYLLGAIGTRGWPHRDRDTDMLLAAIRPWLTDEQAHVDPVHQDLLVAADLALAAFIRIAGPENFPSLRTLDPGRPMTAELIGLELPRFTPTQRAALLDAVDRGPE